LIDEIVMMLRKWCDFAPIIRRATSWVRKKGPRRLILMTRSQLSGVISRRSSRTLTDTPALVTSQSIPPKGTPGFVHGLMVLLDPRNIQCDGACIPACLADGGHRLVEIFRAGKIVHNDREAGFRPRPKRTIFAKRRETGKE